MDHVSIIVINWNAGDVVTRCLAALERQTQPYRELIVFDNASTDSSVSQVEKQFPRARVIRSAVNLGFAAGCNAAVRYATGKWIAILNPDAFPTANWLAQLMVAVQTYPDIACFGSVMISARRADVLDGIGDVYHVSGRVWRAGKGESVASAPREIRQIFSPCAAAALYEREAFLSVGGFDESYFCYLEDVDLGFRLRLRGHECICIPSAIVYHMGSATTGGQHSEFSVYHGHRNLVWTYVKNMPGVLFWVYLPLHILLNVGSVIYLASRGQGTVAVRAKWDAIRGLPRALRQRRQIQSSRRVSAWELRRVMTKGLLTRNLKHSIIARVFDKSQISKL